VAKPATYPTARPRAGPRSYQAADRFGRYESTSAEIGLGDFDTNVISFSGTPDAVWVSSRGAGALVKLSDRLGRETSYFAVQDGHPVLLPVARERVIAKNLVGGVVASLHVTGLWAEPDDRV
jgi:hypothetical protein